jgi:hypothetical protein
MEAVATPSRCCGRTTIGTESLSRVMASSQKGFASEGVGCMSSALVTDAAEEG